MPVCLRSHFSFPLMLMTEMWEFVSFHWGTATFHNSFCSFKIAVILETAKCHLFLIVKAISLVFSLVLSSREIYPMSWKPLVGSVVRFGMPLVHLDFQVLPEMNWKCPDHCYKSGSFLVQISHAACWLSWKGDQSSVSDRESTCLYFQILHFTCKYSL